MTLKVPMKMVTLTVFAFVVSAGDTGVNRDMSVTEGDSVTLHTEVKIKQEDRIKWFFNKIQQDFNKIRIAYITRDFICTDVKCNEGTERFTDRLKVDHQTGSLTIMNTRSTDSGEYKLEAISTDKDEEKTFNVTVYSVSAADKREMDKNTEGESDTSNPGLSAGAVAGICVTVLLVTGATVAAVIYKLQERAVL